LQAKKLEQLSLSSFIDWPGLRAPGNSPEFRKKEAETQDFITRLSSELAPTQLALYCMQLSPLTMSSRDSTPDDDNMCSMREAMAQSSPPKRTHSAMTGNEDPGSEHTASGTASGVRTNQNIVSAARQYAEGKRLRGDQVTALEVF
jgi:hypothetical protein